MNGHTRMRIDIRRAYSNGAASKVIRTLITPVDGRLLEILRSEAPERRRESIQWIEPKYKEAFDVALAGPDPFHFIGGREYRSCRRRWKRGDVVLPMIRGREGFCMDGG